MRYDAKRYYLYPVLRPGSNDYLQGSLSTDVPTPIIDPEIQEFKTSVEFHLSEPTLEKLLLNGQAICAAMLYNSTTLFRRVYTSGVEPMMVPIHASTNALRDNVELQPFIVATERIELSGGGLHPEYGDQVFSILPWQPIAFDETWYFQLNPPTAPIRSIFDFGTNDELRDDQFSVELGERYIRISANQRTREAFEIQRDNRAFSFPSVYLSALMEALVNIRDEYVYGDGEQPLWSKSIQSRMKQLNINIGNVGEEGEHNLFEAAQLLLELPFRYITQYARMNEEDV